MRAYDPAGATYVTWTSSQYDTGGTDYAGPPAFGTLLNVHAYYIFESGGSGGGIPAIGIESIPVDPPASPSAGMNVDTVLDPLEIEKVS